MNEQTRINDLESNSPHYLLPPPHCKFGKVIPWVTWLALKENFKLTNEDYSLVCILSEYTASGNSVLGLTTPQLCGLLQEKQTKVKGKIKRLREANIISINTKWDEEKNITTREIKLNPEIFDQEISTKTLTILGKKAKQIELEVREQNNSPNVTISEHPSVEVPYLVLLPEQFFLHDSTLGKIPITQQQWEEHRRKLLTEEQNQRALFITHQELQENYTDLWEKQKQEFVL